MIKEDDEEQKYIDKYCNTCKKERVFVTSLSPKVDLVCTTCGCRMPMNKFKFIQDQFGYRIKEGGK